MNGKNISIIYIVVIIAMILYPPFTIEFNNMILGNGYSWIWEPITNDRLFGTISDSQLLMQFIAATLVALAALMASE